MRCPPPGTAPAAPDDNPMFSYARETNSPFRRRAGQPERFTPENTEAPARPAGRNQSHPQITQIRADVPDEPNRGTGEKRVAAGLDRPVRKFAGGAKKDGDCDTEEDI